MTSDSFATSAADVTRSPSASAFSLLLLAAWRPTTTSTPLSRRLRAWAWPWLP